MTSSEASGLTDTELADDLLHDSDPLMKKACADPLVRSVHRVAVVVVHLEGRDAVGGHAPRAEKAAVGCALSDQRSDDLPRLDALHHGAERLIQVRVHRSGSGGDSSEHHLELAPLTDQHTKLLDHRLR